ncbi:MAG TPA: hypothetical protein VG225_07195 [Terracidiphilus sp.]|jgi:hypothetical protein|nr:hypothetical protein [Terracidiphilus sp.]
MNESLHPSTLGEILDRTTNLYRSRFLVFFGIASVPAGVLLGVGGALVLLGSWSGTAQSGPAIALVIGMALLALVGFPAMVAASGLSAAALCHAASALMMGEPISISSAYRAVWKRGWSYIGLYVLEGLIIAAVPLVVWSVLLAMVGVAAVAGKAGPGSEVLVGSASVLLFLGVVVYAVWMLLQVCLAFPAAVVEQMPVGSALKRAWTLSAGTRWRMLVLFVLGVALGWVATLLLIVPLAIAISLMPGMNSPQHAEMVGTVVMIGFYGASFAVQALTRPVYGIALVLFYYDQRVRKEGFDIELLMRQAGMVQEPAPQPTIPWMQMPSVVPAPGAEPPAEVAAAAQSGTNEAISDNTAGGAA